MTYGYMRLVLTEVEVTGYTEHFLENMAERIYGMHARENIL